MHDSEWNDPPLSAKVEVAMHSLGWMILVGMAGGTAWWCHTFRRVLHGN